MPPWPRLTDREQVTVPCASFDSFQSGNKAFSLAADNGCVEMLKMLMDEYEMATMKPNQARVDSGCLMPKRVWRHICYEFHL